MDRSPLLRRIEPPIQRVLDLLQFVQTETHENEIVDSVLSEVMKILTSKDLYKVLSKLPDRESNTSKDIFSFWTSGIDGGSELIPLRSPTFLEFLKRSPRRKESDQSSNLETSEAIVISPELQEHLAAVTDWSFNVLKVEQLLSKGRVLRHVGMEIFRQYKVYEVLKIPVELADNLLLKWLGMVENSYHLQNAYHNSTHAADVMQAMAYYVKLPEVSCLLGELDGVAALIGAAIHDCDHPGRNSKFLINVRHPLALLYNDTSVLENHHVSHAWRQTVESTDCNIFQYLNEEELSQMRKTLISVVIATDMTQHFQIVQWFKQVLPQLQAGKLLHPRDPQHIDPLSMLLRMLIKAADISNPARPWDQCIIWAERIIEEYMEQTEEELENKLPVTLKDFRRGNCNKPETQRAFMEIYVLELFNSLTQLCGSLNYPNGPLDNLKRNFATWVNMKNAGIKDIPADSLAVYGGTPAPSVLLAKITKQRSEASDDTLVFTQLNAANISDEEEDGYGDVYYTDPAATK